ncbi:MAG: copper resistance protein CopC [Gaiellaceae bacterium]
MRRIVFIAALAALTWPSAASAHARLQRSDPPDGAVVGKAPAVVRLFFDDTIEPIGGTRAIRNGGGSVLSGKPYRPRGKSRELVVPLRARLSTGDYTVLWKALSNDGHIVEGVIAFAVGAGRAPPTAALSAASPGPRAKDVTFRWLFLAGLLTAVGAAAFELFVLRHERQESTVPYALMAVGFALAAGGVAGLVPHHQATTRFGITYQIGGAIALAGALLGVLRLAEPRLRFLPSLAALALLPVPSIAGHAMDAGQPRVLSVAADILHIGAAAIWVGGLLCLALVGRLPGVARRFSAVALVTVAVLATTGVVRALVELTSVDQLWSSGYGRALLVKTGLLALVLAVAWRSRYRLLSRFDALRRNVAAELVLLAGIVIAVSFLTDLTPGRDLPAVAAKRPTAVQVEPPPPPSDALVLATEDDQLAVALAVRPRGEVEATVIGPNGYAASGLDLAFKLGRHTVAATSCGPGCYRATRGLRRPARTLIRVLVSGRGPAFTLPARWPAPTADAIVGRATRVFRRLRTLVIHERLASSPQNFLKTTYELVAPNRLAYQIAGGAQAIVIGDRRWDRDNARARWQRSSQTPLRQPTPFWTSWTRSHLLGTAQLGGRPVWLASFYDPASPAWFKVWIDKRSYRTLQLRMTAAAHFMHHVYGPFDAPIRIAPPK